MLNKKSMLWNKKPNADLSAFRLFAFKHKDRDHNNAIESLLYKYNFATTKCPSSLSPALLKCYTKNISFYTPVRNKSWG